MYILYSTGILWSTIMLQEWKSTVTIPAKMLISMMVFTREQNASRILAMAWAIVRLSIHPSVTLWYYIKTVQARITKSSLCAAPTTLVYRDENLCFWV